MPPSAGDSERLIEAQEKLTEAKFRLQRQAVEESTLQESEVVIPSHIPKPLLGPSFPISKPSKNTLDVPDCLDTAI